MGQETKHETEEGLRLVLRGLFASGQANKSLFCIKPPMVDLLGVDTLGPSALALVFPIVRENTWSFWRSGFVIDNKQFRPALIGVYNEYIAGTNNIFEKEQRHRYFVKFLETNKKSLVGEGFKIAEFYQELNSKTSAKRTAKIEQHVSEYYKNKLKKTDDKDLLNIIYLQLHSPLIYPKFADEIKKLICDTDGNLDETRAKHYLDLLFDDEKLKGSTFRGRSHGISLSRKTAALVVNIFVACNTVKLKDQGKADLWEKYKKLLGFFHEDDSYYDQSLAWRAMDKLRVDEPLLNGTLRAKKFTLGLVFMLTAAGLVAAGGAALSNVFFKDDDTLQAVAFGLGAGLGVAYGIWKFYSKLKGSEESNLRILAKGFAESPDNNAIYHYSWSYIGESLAFAGVGLFMAGSIIYYLDGGIELLSDSEGLLDLDADLYIALIVAIGVLGLAAGYFNHELEMARAEDVLEANETDMLSKVILPPEAVDDIVLAGATASSSPSPSGSV